ncbi:MAG: hypothetical protein DMD35_17890 [Gemmatimonadetes bacterium]|nr:MAG: hypothetical protein DMD35_17890 [Gemmatimonadota bacterium]
MAEAKLMASFLGRPATSLPTTLSPASGSVTASDVVTALGGATAGADGVLAVADGMPVAATESAVDGAALSTGAGVDETSPPLTPERGASATQAVRTTSETTARREVRAGDM